MAIKGDAYQAGIASQTSLLSRMKIFSTIVLAVAAVQQALAHYRFLGAATTTGTLTVAAGSTATFSVYTSIGHPGPLLWYMAKAPSGTVNGWDGSGNVWFKIGQTGATFSGGAMSWPSSGLTSVSIKIPSSLPSGEYLLRVEHIALHGAGSVGGSQHYISCAQLKVTGGGSGNPSPLVSFPGAYSPQDPGILINIYWPVPTSYTPPGPSVWQG
ncbi:hypothetical protein FRB91_005797 [Serendipita sp. 411]|nr:hypothetical protein FRB91_005797 [Serendipita sp. 411]KAG8868583.1 hypothetical protein FRC20_003101 [Serendipita sp. 405]